MTLLSKNCASQPVAGQKLYMAKPSGQGVYPNKIKVVSRCYQGCEFELCQIVGLHCQL